MDIAERFSSMFDLLVVRVKMNVIYIIWMGWAFGYCYICLVIVCMVVGQIKDEINAGFRGPGLYLYIIMEIYRAAYNKLNMSKYNNNCILF